MATNLNDQTSKFATPKPAATPLTKRFLSVVPAKLSRVPQRPMSTLSDAAKSTANTVSAKRKTTDEDMDNPISKRQKIAFSRTSVDLPLSVIHTSTPKRDASSSVISKVVKHKRKANSSQDKILLLEKTIAILRERINLMNKLIANLETERSIVQTA